MVINFRTHKISQDTRMLVRTTTLIPKKKKSACLLYVALVFRQQKPPYLSSLLPHLYSLIFLSSLANFPSEFLFPSIFVVANRVEFNLG